MSNETKREKFVRLTENRMNNVLKGIDLLGNMSNANNYEFTQEDLNKIIKTLKGAVADLERKYNGSTKSSRFKL